MLVFGMEGRGVIGSRDSSERRDDILFMEDISLCDLVDLELFQLCQIGDLERLEELDGVGLRVSWAGLDP